MLAGILSTARRNNLQNKISGALICRHDIYLQLIEGPADLVDALYDRICCDDRHTNIEKLLEEDVSERMFGAWAMLDDEAPSLFWSVDEVEAGVLAKASRDELLAPFIRLSEAKSG
jgi:hypothetical protein